MGQGRCRVSQAEDTEASPFFFPACTDKYKRHARHISRGATLWIREEGCAKCNCDAAKAGWGNGVQTRVWGEPGWGRRRLGTEAGGARQLAWGENGLEGSL